MGVVGAIAGGTRSLSALILALLLIPLCVIALGAVQAQAAVGPGFYKEAFTRVGLYDSWPSAVGAQIAHQIALGAEATEGEGAPAALQQLDAGDWADLLRKIAPAEWSRMTVESALDQAFADPPPATIRLSLVELREHLRSGVTAGEYDALLLALASDADVDESGVPFTTSFAADLLSAKVDDIPDATEIPWAGEIGADADGPPLSITSARNVLRGLSAVPLLAIVPLLLLVVRSTRSAARWVGIPIALGSVVTLTLALSVGPFIERILTTTVARVPNAIAPELATLMHGLAVRFADSMTSGLVLVAASASLVTAAAMIVALRPRRSAALTEVASRVAV